MRIILVSAFAFLLLIQTIQAGLVHRPIRDVDFSARPAISNEPFASQLRNDQIPVAVIEDQEPQIVLRTIQSEQRVEPPVLVAEPEPIATDVITSQTDILKAGLATAEIAEDIAKAVEEDQKIRTSEAVAEAEEHLDLATDTAVVKEEIKETIEDENKELLQAVAEIEKAGGNADDSKKIVKKVINEEEQQPDLTIGVNNDVAALVNEEVVNVPEADASGTGTVLRQVTTPTPGLSTTQQNFVQQLVQNSPIGQFISQLTGQPQQGQADEPATPAPTIPGLQAVQTVAQAVVNTTNQAFQGFQQFASNLGNQFQNTLSTLSGQQNQAATGISTTRRPGPFQSIVNNIVGNNPNGDSTTPANQQQQGPLQGIISFFQGGNRPQNPGNAAAANPTETDNNPAIQLSDKPLDDKLDQKPEKIDVAATEVEADATNEVRNSEEAVEDSFESSQPGELIIVNDGEAKQPEVVA